MPNLIDLYCGVGGLSLGAARAGFRVAAAIDNDPIAMDSHRKNYPSTRHLTKDVSKLNGEAVLKLADLRKGQLDGLVGGPPCQGFSYMGRRDPNDNRNSLFVDFFRLVNESQPKFFLAENVPGILDEQYSEIRQHAFALVAAEYALLSPMKVVASDYGAPTTRTRVFFFGYKKQYFHDIDCGLFGKSESTVSVKVKDALEGLSARIDHRWTSEEQSWRSVGKMKKSQFADSVSGRVPTDIGDLAALTRYFEDKEASGFLATRHDAEVRKRFARVPQGKTDPVSRAPRLDLNGYCPTIRAGTGKDRGSYQSLRPIHPTAHRVITPREAARLQGFPDWFVFHPTKWHSFRQIGNSVSPIVAEAILHSIVSKMRDADG